MTALQQERHGQENHPGPTSRLHNEGERRRNWGPKDAPQGVKMPHDATVKGYKGPSNEEGFEDVARKRQQHISHMAEDEDLPEEDEDFKELKVIKQD
ncbi:hypothetical protein KUCAC02_017367 [Chaenocephalus aceratus]|uniref:Uncharacterized protein n=1 Tax=Chaenocephalus aceratus TaxID=36190 RepID=A0ACB9W2E0_CHAAC|nr:hypothetical protein KUCAC02_017367 [Chaenocephalus aceratus]